MRRYNLKNLQVIVTFIYSILNNGSVLLYQLIFPILMVQGFGLAGYGEIAWVLGMSQLVLIMEFGVASIIGNYISRKGGVKFQYQAVYYAFNFLLSITVTIAAFATALAYLKVIDGKIYLAFLSCLPLLWTLYYGSLLRGEKRISVYLKWQSLGRIAELGIFGILVSLASPRIDAIFFVMGFLRVILVLILKYSLINNPLSKLNIKISQNKKLKKTIIKNLLVNSLSYSVFGWINFIRNNVPVIVFGQFGDKEYVAMYAITKTLANVVLQISQTINQTIWQYAGMVGVARNSIKDSNFLLGLPFIFISIFFCLISTLIYVFSEQIVSAWLSSAVVLDSLTTKILLFISLMYAIWSYQNTVLVANNQHSVFSITALVFVLIAGSIFTSLVVTDNHEYGLYSLAVTELGLIIFATYFCFKKGYYN